MKSCSELCYYNVNGLCPIPVGLITLKHCDCGKCLKQQEKEKEKGAERIDG